MGQLFSGFSRDFSQGVVIFERDEPRRLPVTGIDAAVTEVLG